MKARIILLIQTVIIVVLFVFAFYQKTLTDKNFQEALQQKTIAIQQQELAVKSEQQAKRDAKAHEAALRAAEKMVLDCMSSKKK